MVRPEEGLLGSEHYAAVRTSRKTAPRENADALAYVIGTFAASTEAVSGRGRPGSLAPRMVAGDARVIRRGHAAIR